MSDDLDMGGHRERERQLGREVALWIRIRDLEADRDAWKAKYEAAIEALRQPVTWLEHIRPATRDCVYAPPPARVLAEVNRILSDRAASLVSDHDRAKEASDAG